MSGKNCSQICLDSSLIYAPELPLNLVNCGIYAAYCYAKENIDAYKSLGPNFDEQFQRLGFLKSNESCGDNDIAPRMQYNMTACVMLGYNQLNGEDYRQISVPWACTNPAMFAGGSMQVCYETLCVPRSFDPDVLFERLKHSQLYSSLIMQSSIAIATMALSRGTSSRESSPGFENGCG